jgi:hypothetical protein
MTRSFGLLELGALHGDIIGYIPEDFKKFFPGKNLYTAISMI